MSPGSGPATCPKSRTLLVIAALFLTLPASPIFADSSPTALVPVEVFAPGFRELRGLAWGPDQALYASDRDAGVIYRLAPASEGGPQISIGQAGLRRPGGLAWGSDNLLYVAEEGAGRIVRLNGTPIPIWTGLFHPTWVAVAPDGTLFVIAKPSPGKRRKGKEDDEAEDGFQLLQRRPGAATADLLLSGIHHPGGLWLEPAGTLLLTLDKLEGQSEKTSPTLLRLDPRIPSTDTRFLTSLLGPGVKRPVGPAVDALGALLVGARKYRPPPRKGAEGEDEEDDDSLEEVLLKLRAGQPVTVLGGGFEEGRALALDPQGHLYVATGETIYRLQAPAPPTLDRPPEFTNQSPLPLHGTAAPDNEITVLGGQAPATGQADPLTGAFSLAVPLTPNAENHLRIYTTSVHGQGLTSAAAELPVLQDNRPPKVNVTKPASGALVRGSVEVTGQAEETREGDEAWSGVAAVRLAAAAVQIAAVTNPVPESPSPFTISGAWQTATLADGSYTLTATAIDRAGNSATDSITVTVDNTPPTVAFTTPGSGSTVSGVVTVTIEGSDTTSGLGTLTLAVDGVLRQTSATTLLTYPLDTRPLGAGPHTLTATATDRAGNTAGASRTVTVQNLLVRITDPTDGGTLTQDRVWVTGIVAASGEVGVTVNGIPAFVQGAQWVAEVPLVVGSNVITATATDVTGTQATASITVSVPQATPAALLLRALPESGVAPLQVTWQMSNQTGRTLVRFEFDPTGSGAFGPPTATFDGTQTTYSTPGLFLPTLRATDDQGTTYTASIVINVLDRAQMDALLKAKWMGMKTSLAAGDAAGALALIAVQSRDSYATLFAALGDQLPALAADMPEIQPVYFEGTFAKYRLRRPQSVGGTMMTITHYIYLSVDVDGIWRIESF